MERAEKFQSDHATPAFRPVVPPAFPNRPFKLEVFVFPFQTICDVIPENRFFQMSSLYVHPRAYVCIIFEKTKGKFSGEHQVARIGEKNVQS